MKRALVAIIAIADLCSRQIQTAVAATGSSGQVVGSPAAIQPTPSANQIAWQDLELTGFCHFGINTFYDQEWGNGTEDPNRFYPTNFDASQWVEVFKTAGFKQLILTAKHHDGFCLWPSAYTKHSVKSSAWYREREATTKGSGDVVKAVADACHAAGMKFGVYLSPWDRNSPYYGQGKKYNKFYADQLRELLTNYGKVDEVWWDGAKGDDKKQEYDYGAWAVLVHKLQPTAVIFQGNYNTADIRWVGNEDGHAPEDCWPAVDHDLKPSPIGSKWMPAETDVSIRPGWFYHQSEDSAVKSVEALLDIYKNSVGRNSQLLLNVPPDKRGLIAECDKVRLEELKSLLNATFGANLAERARPTASSSRGEGYGPENVLDADPNTYWAASDGVTNASLTLDLGSARTFDMIELQEPINLGLRITGYSLEAGDGRHWQELARRKCIGRKAIVSFPTITASIVRLNISAARAWPAISSFKIFNNANVSLANQALGKTATSDTEEDEHGPANGNDGDAGTRWCAVDGAENHWWKVDLGRTYRLTASQIVWEMAQPDTIYQYKIEVSPDDVAWTLAADKSRNTDTQQNQTDRLSAEGRYVRITVLSVSNEQWASFYEFVLHGSPAPDNARAESRASSQSP